MNIAIDGPAGAGKSTIAKAVARELNSIYVDTGAMYRAMALYMLKNDISSDDTESIEKACESADISIVYKEGAQHVILNGQDVTGELRMEAVGNMASSVSINGKVRKKLVSLQQKLAHSTSVVMDGRDIGTVVLPDADLKIYLTASVETRADRRYKELIEKGQQPNLDEIRRAIADRDNRDMNRENSPLRQAEDAVLVDSSDMTIPEVVDRILGLTEGLHK